ncbi:DsbA family protein [Microbacterium album]|uniref:Thioredoxin-like fold domain-containing protein n=1 Tax=Microbacterium album TaxID=2053191 RepID=A0A917IFM0_9MICO|nr:thioredoxin domain-containing protein [Microbacterium album]GGH41352.1 hypothetical protein GCM10010921_13880 [Microbacterium album]
MAKAATNNTNWVAIWISVAVVVMLVAVGALVVWMNNQATAPAEPPAAGQIDEATGAIRVGDGEHVLEEYVDFMCPHCANFHNTYGETIAEQVEAGTLTLEIHPISILDSQSQGTQFSTRAANAMYCVAETEPDAVYSFYDLLFANQPGQGSSGLSDDRLVQLAERAGARDAVDCITDVSYADFVAEKTQETPVQPGASGISTPTVLIDGEFLSLGSLTGDPEADVLSRIGQ